MLQVLLRLAGVNIMNRESIISALGVWFDVRELVCPHVWGRFGESSWQFLDTSFLDVLLMLRRDVLGVAMYCNTWKDGGGFSQRGFRCNRCDMVRGKSGVYVSAHCLGKAGDFSLGGGMSAEAARGLIKGASGLFGCNVRVEGGVSWLHVDVLPQWGVTDKVYEFRA